MKNSYYQGRNFEKEHRVGDPSFQGWLGVQSVPLLPDLRKYRWGHTDTLKVDGLYASIHYLTKE